MPQTVVKQEYETPQNSEETLPENNKDISSLPIFGWFLRKGFPQGAFWSIMICLISATNDVLQRFLGENLHYTEITFFRFLFSMLTIIPLMVSKGTTLFKTTRPMMHVLRAFVGVGAFFACCYGVQVMPLNENTIITSAQPLFFLPLAILFLKEKVSLSLWIANIIGLLGIALVVQPDTDTFRILALIPIAAALQFALLDILAKKMVATENNYSMIFYFAFGTTVLSFLPALYFWVTPTLWDLFLLLLLGIGASLIQVCLYRAFSACDASSLTPFRFTDFAFSSLFGYLLFSEILKKETILGAALIIAGTLFISYTKTKEENVS